MHIAVSDESFAKPYWAMGFISGPEKDILCLNKEIGSILVAKQKHELKWTEVNNKERQEATIESLKVFFNYPSVRAYVITWDLTDRRHAIPERDDHENFHIMAFNALRQIADWHGVSNWAWFPDEKNELNEALVADFLNNTRQHKAWRRNEPLWYEPTANLNFKKPIQKDSKKVPVIGLADIFAGMVRHSIGRSKDCIEHCNKIMSADQLTLDIDATDDEGPKLSARELAKLEVMSQFRMLVKKHRLTLSLSKEDRFATHDKKGPIFIHHYKPVRPDDFAPTRKSKD